MARVAPGWGWRMQIRIKAVLAVLVAVVIGGAWSLAGAREPVQPLPSLAEPSLSPDGQTIAFASGGDIWTVPAAGGVARLLVTDPATESRPLWSPDGTRLAFVSTRSGVANLYILTLATGAVTRLTWGDIGETLDGWSRDSQWIYFTSGVNDVQRLGDIFRVRAAGGVPLEVSAERYLNEFQAAPSPDGQAIALMARGISNSQWWRHGSSHIDQTELWLKPIAAGAPYRQLLPSGARHAWPMWRPDGGALWYMSDEDGNENLWRLTLGGKPEQVTRFRDGRVLWPTIGYDGRTIVFERGFAIWSLDTASGKVRQVPITLQGAPAAAGESRLSLSDFDDLALSPDGKKIAVIAHGELFATTAKDGGPAQRVTRTAGLERDPMWSPDSRQLLYASERGLAANIYAWDFATATERPLTTGAGRSTVPVWSPDGKMVAYVRGGHELHVITLADNGTVAKDATIWSGALDGFEDGAPVWSPDSRWIVFVVTDRKAFGNLHVIPAAGGEARPISFLANGQTGGRIVWSPDGRFIITDTGQRSEDAKLLRIDLLPNTPKYREDAFRELFKPTTTPDTPSPAPEAPGADDAAPPATPAAAAPAPPAAAAKPAKKPAPVKIVFEGIRERASFIPVGLDSGEPSISPDGKTLLFQARAAGVINYYTWNLDELAREPPVAVQLTSSRKGKSSAVFTPDSKSVFYLDGGAIYSTPVESPKPKALAVSADMEVDFDTEKMVVFDQAWGVLDRGFYDPKFHGKDWNALRAAWLPYIAGARTGDELRRDINLMIGELDASHSGIRGPDAGPPPGRIGDLGLRYDREAYEAGKGLVIREVIALGPAAIEGTIKPGETLVAVNGEKLTPGVSLDRLLRGQAGKRVVLTIGAAGAPAKTREAVVRPVSPAVASGLLYRQWVNDRRALVERVSGGRLGYVHIPDMGDASLAQLYIDLDAQNQGREGVVIDIRNNNGGYINGYALDVFTRRNYLLMTARDRFPVPARQNLGQRALGLPTVLVTNESSLSDAEDFTEGYRSLGLGKVVGKPTAGWIIFTGGRDLIDGSSVRLPFIRIDDLRGQNMELNPRPVDLDIDRPLGETAAGKDAQLEAAVKVLLSR